MDTPLTPLHTRRHLLALLDRLRAAERAAQPAHGYAARMIDFEQEQLLAELARLTDGGEVKPDAAESPESHREPWSLKTSLAAMLEGFVNAFRTRTA